MSLLILQWTINALAIVIAVKVVDGITFEGQWWEMLIIGVLFGLINSLIKPIIRIFTIPIIMVTLGIFALIINAAMLGLTAIISRELDLGFNIEGFWPAFWGAVIVSVISILLSWLTGLKRFREKIVTK